MIETLTKNQQLVFDVLLKAHAPLSAYNLLDELRDDGLRAPPQIYRALEKLMEYGMVHRLDSMNAFVACSHDDHHHEGFTAFSICNDCGEVTEFNDPEISKRLDSWASQHKFVRQTTTVELRGQCEKCAHA